MMVNERSYLRGAGGVADIISAATTASSILMGGVIRGAHSLAIFFFLSNFDFDNSQASSSSSVHPALPLIQ